MGEPLVVVGDIHGEAGQLAAMLSQVLNLGRRVVFVGDYVNRGESSRQVIDLLVQTKREFGSQVVFLAGNHELALLDFLDSADFVPFARHGGMATIRSYVGEAKGDVHAQFSEAFPASHEEMLRSGLQDYYENEEVFISHAGFDPSAPGRRDREVLVQNSHPELFSAIRDILLRPLVVFGHYVQSNAEPFDQNGLICIDTGCGTIRGPLTAVMLPEHRFLVA